MLFKWTVCIESERLFRCSFQHEIFTFGSIIITAMFVDICFKWNATFLAKQVDQRRNKKMPIRYKHTRYPIRKTTFSHSSTCSSQCDTYIPNICGPISFYSHQMQYITKQYKRIQCHSVCFFLLFDLILARFSILYRRLLRSFCIFFIFTPSFPLLSRMYICMCCKNMRYLMSDMYSYAILIKFNLFHWTRVECGNVGAPLPLIQMSLSELWWRSETKLNQRKFTAKHSEMPRKGREWERTDYRLLNNINGRK